MNHRLSDGRTLAYAEYGDPQGAPVFFFHGAPGSRLFHPPDDATKRAGARLICVERPGYGNSTFQPDRRLLDWPKDVAALADALEIDRFSIAGHSAGGPHTLACAYALPDRVSAATVVAGAGPVDAPGAADGMVFLNWLAFTLGQYIPWPIIRLVVRQVFREQAADPSKAIDHDRATRPTVDNEVLDRPDVRALCMQSDGEAYRQGTLGLARDVYLVTRRWDFPLEKIAVPVHLWHGTLDNSTSLAMARYMAEKIPGASLSVCEGEGHMLLMDHWEKILRALIEVAVLA